MIKGLEWDFAAVIPEVAFAYLFAKTGQLVIAKSKAKSLAFKVIDRNLSLSRSYSFAVSFREASYSVKLADQLTIAVVAAQVLIMAFIEAKPYRTVEIAKIGPFKCAFT